MNPQKMTKTQLLGELKNLQKQVAESNKSNPLVSSPENHKEALEWQKTIFEGSRDAIFISNENSRFIMVNQAASHLTGYSKQELLKMRIPDLHDKIDLQAYHQYHDAIIAGEEVVSEARILRKDGTKVDTEFNNRRINIAAKRYMHTVARDVTQRKRVDQALKEMNLALTNAMTGISRLDPLGKYISLNQSYAELLGYTPEELIGRPWQETVHLDDQPMAVSAYLRMRKEGKAELEGRGVRKDGSKLYKHILMVRETSNEGQFIGHHCFVRDITERKLAEEALRTSQERYRVLFDENPSMCFTVDAKGIVLSVNKTGAEQLGYTVKELVGQSVLGIFYEDDKKAVQRQLRDCLKKPNEIASWELRKVNKDGEIVWVREIARTIQNVNGEPILLIGCENITERRLLQDQLARAQRLETAGRVAGQIAHDFNNLLAPLIGFPDLIRRKLPQDHPVIELIDEMELSSNEIAEISQQLLALGRRGYYKLEPLNLNDVIRKILTSQSLPREIKLQEKLDANLFLIKGGKAQLTRVLANLFNNAKEAMNNIGVFSIKTENIYLDNPLAGYQKIEQGEYVRVEISDTGSGIESEVLDKIFDPFFTTKKMDRMRGSGLGLSVVHSIVEDHNGYVTVDSLIGQGTTFSLYFPITRELDDIKKDKDEKLTGGDETILVVDDDPVQRSVMGQLLKPLGYEVEIVDSGEQALTSVNKRGFDLLILDMVMNGMDGAETFRQILKMNPSQKAIIVSGHAVSQRVQNALGLGAGAFLPKPLKMGELANSVRKVLDMEQKEDRR